ncbi:MAG: hypothetical protein D6694_06605 [Gammaproteobacteria bacterium]|nr:MAG: hypothetical protein D6694_06605 [Gammaproteobacteria bacterium]
MFLPSVSGATGATSTEQSPQQIAEQQLAQKTRYEEAIRRMEEHLYLAKDGQLHLNVRRGSEIGVPEGIFAELQASLGYLNTQIRAGAIRLEEVSLSSGRNIYGQEVPLTVVASGTPAGLAPQAAACAGWTGIRWFWYGPRYYANECLTRNIIHTLSVGAALGWLSAELGFIPDAVVAALAAVGAGALAWIDDIGGNRGIYWQTTWLGQWGYVWHQ